MGGRDWFGSDTADSTVDLAQAKEAIDAIAGGQTPPPPRGALTREEAPPIPH